MRPRRWGWPCFCLASPWGRHLPISYLRRTLQKQKDLWRVHGRYASSKHREEIVTPFYLFILFLKVQLLTLRSDINFLSSVCSRKWGLTCSIEPWTTGKIHFYTFVCLNLMWKASYSSPTSWQLGLEPSRSRHWPCDWSSRMHHRPAGSPRWMKEWAQCWLNQTQPTVYQQGVNQWTNQNVSYRHDNNINTVIIHWKILESWMSF